LAAGLDKLGKSVPCVIASASKQSIFPQVKMDWVGMDCFVAHAPRNDASGVIHRHCERMRRGCSNGYVRHNDLSTVIRGQQREARLRVDDPPIHFFAK
jgi:hypothetical protein